MTDFAAAIAFLTRLGQPSILTENSLARGIAWFGAAGLVLGIILLAATCLFLFLLPGLPLWCTAIIGGWFWLSLEVWLTRGLHWDGVADLGDALGSCAKAGKFWLILKDSRMGAFGAMALMLFMAGQALAVTAHLAAAFAAIQASLPEENFLAQARLLPLFTLAAAPAWSRLAPVWLGFNLHAHAPNSLGAIICDHLSRKILLMAFAQAAVLLLMALSLSLPFLSAIAIIACQSALTFWLRRIARSNNGLSGDFFGFQIEASQLLWLLIGSTFH